jgi:formate dehydrogenase subunit gamma
VRPATRVPEQPSSDKIVRYSHAARLAHWAVAVAYVALFLSGLALFHPFFFWLSAVFGGAAFMRIIHPFLGVAFTVLFYVWAARLWNDNLWKKGDSAWLKGMFKYMNRAPGGDVPVEGKYNAGQKAMYWSMVVVIFALLVTGLLIWRPYIAPGISAPVKQLSGLLHALMAFIMFVGIGIHIYAAYWTKGSIRAMTRGTVSRRWARHHHPGWFAKMAPKERQ